MTPLIMAAKKHQTEVRNCVKNMTETAQDKNIKTPTKWVLLILDTKRGAIVTDRYTRRAQVRSERGKSVLY